jgi:hypothetical protein
MKFYLIEKEKEKEKTIALYQVQCILFIYYINKMVRECALIKIQGFIISD